MGDYYTSERNTQILIELLKKHGIRKIIASPGSTNIQFVASIQNDDFFEIYSVVDERSAAYMACGLAEKSGEVVALICTGATASRNYVSALTEAYYRHIPILAITSTLPLDRIGHNFPQVIDRTVLLKDIAKLSVLLPEVKTEEDEWACMVNANEALLALLQGNKGPVHINLVTTYNYDFIPKKVEGTNYIERIEQNMNVPSINVENVAIFVGSHSVWDERLTKAVDEFCELYNAIVICDHTSNYKGKYGILAGIITGQDYYKPDCNDIDLLIHIGNTSGAYYSLAPKQVWRVDKEGKVCDTFKKLKKVFEMDECAFFEKYLLNGRNKRKSTEFYTYWKKEYAKLLAKIPQLPFSNLWIAQQLSKKLSKNVVLHFGILNSLRAWNYFEIPQTVMGYSNTGGFGIDGCVSTLVGASLASKDKIYFGIVGDLAFFYDMNVLGNRHIPGNVRLLVVNNGQGVEFRNYNHLGTQFGEDTAKYIAAEGHNGCKSPKLIKNYCTDLGYRYMSASSCDEFRKQMNDFLNSEDIPVVFEVFTNIDDESEALKIMHTLEMSNMSKAKNSIKNIVGEENVKLAKKILRKK